MNLILGGTSGLGAEIASLYKERGEETFVIGRSYDRTKHGQGIQADLSRLEDVHMLCETIGDLAIKRFFWVTGYGYVGDFAEQPEPEVMAAVNFGNALPVIQTAWKHMLNLETGHTEGTLQAHLVGISSTSGFKARKDEAVYAGTKHAVVGFMRSLGLESERLGAPVKVALIMPGGMQTPFWEGNQPGAYDEFNDPAKVAAKIIKDIDDQDEPYFEEVIERGTV